VPPLAIRGSLSPSWLAYPPSHREKTRRSARPNERLSKFIRSFT
jgi:hypothetical protein